MSKSVVIIGGGIAGLAAGCYARMNGFRARIFELHDRPGGSVPVAAMSGRNAIQLICHDEGQPFLTETP